MQNNLNAKIGQATKWSSITTFVSKLISPITNAVLARLLIPEMFGVVATLTMVVSFAEIFTDAGFQKFLVQHEFENEEELDKNTNVAFWTNLVVSLLIWAVIAMFAEPIAALVGSPGCGIAVIVMCVQIPLVAFSSIQSARFRREFDFKTLFFVQMGTAAIPLIVTVPLAILLRNYWALVIGTLLRDVFNAVVLTAKSKWKPSLHYSFSKLKGMLSFSLWSMVENVSIWLTSYMGTFIISGFFNSYYLGMYKTTISTVGAYMGLITGATTPVLFTGLSRCQNDEKEFRRVFFHFQRMVALFVFPLGGGLFVYRRLATLILLGNQWLETADFIGMWALTSSITIIFSHYNSEVFRSKGKPKLSVLVQLLHIAALVPVLLWSCPQGYTVLSVARSVVRLELILVSCVILQMAIGIKFTSILKNVWPSLVASTIMTVAGMYLRILIPGVAWEIATVLMCIVIYVVTMLVIPVGRRQLAEVPILCKVFRLK